VFPNPSHRPSLLKYHNRHLRLGDAAPVATPVETLPRVQSRLALHGWQLTTLASTSHEEQLETDMEIQRLERIIGTNVGEWESRLREVNRELSGK
jgi:ATP-binding cassette subfamily D (ALD) long-chain fatty acid import protein